MSTPNIGAIEKNIQSDETLETPRQSRDFERGEEIRVSRDSGGLWKSIHGGVTKHHESVLTARQNSRIVNIEPEQ